MNATDTFCQLAGVDVPLICGAMYPCSNPELVGAVAAAGAMAIVQPLSLVYVHGRDFREGVREIRELAGGRPFGFNAIIEKSAKAYEKRMRRWIESISLRAKPMRHSSQRCGLPNGTPVSESPS